MRIGQHARYAPSCSDQLFGTVGSPSALAPDGFKGLSFETTSPTNGLGWPLC